jgi:hypothetical protein
VRTLGRVPGAAGIRATRAAVAELGTETEFLWLTLLPGKPVAK